MQVSRATQDILVFGNPISGQGRGLRIAQGVAEGAARAGFNARLYIEHPESTPADWIPPRADDVVVSIGGDGSLRSVVDRLIRHREEGGVMPSLITVPLGTANLVATHLHSRWPAGRIPQEVLEAIRHGARQRLDLAMANGQAMLAVGGVGFDAQVVHDLALNRRGPITYANYLMPTVRSITGYRFRPITVTIDGVDLVQDRPAIAFVGNIPEYGAGFAVTPMARSDDGLLDVCVLPCGSLQELFELGCICGTGLQVSSDRAIYRRGQHVEITSSEPVPVQIDGESSGFTPVSFDLLEQQLTFIVPHR